MLNQNENESSQKFDNLTIQVESSKNEAASLKQ